MERHDGVPIREVARRLGTSVSALRKRVERQTVEAYRAADGTWRVVLPPDATSEESRGATRGATDTTEQGEVVALRDLVVVLKAQVATQQDQITEKDRQISELHVLLQTAQQNEQRLLSAGTIEPETTIAAEERRRREEVERERDDLRARLDALSPAPTHATAAPAGVREATGASARTRPSWFRRVFFGE